jgi:hypothetical protein
VKLRRVVRVSVVLLLWVPVVVLGTKFAIGLTSADFAGYDMGAKATAVQLVFDSPSLGVPANPTGELNLAFSEATFKSGPSGYGLGSLVWPGQVVAALPPFIIGIIEEQAMSDIPLDLPTYPVRAETFYPAGPQDSSFQLGTSVMSSKAHDTFTEANAHLNSFAFPGIISLGSQTSMVSDGFDTAGAVSMAEAAVSDLSIQGVLTIDGVVTRATARSNGEKGSVAGATTVTGVEVGGIAVTIDNEGVKVADQTGPGVAAAQQAVNQSLLQAGISIELAAPVDTIAGPSATRALGGVIVNMKSDPLNAVLALLPPDIRKQITDNITFDQTFSISIAPAVVSAGAGLGIDQAPPADVAIPPAADLGGDTSVPVDTSSGDTGTGDTGGTTVPSGNAPVSLSNDFDGVPLWLVIVLLLVALASSRPLMMAADRLFAARGVVAACPNGGT